MTDEIIRTCEGIIETESFSVPVYSALEYRLAKHILAASEARKWQPMETAPQDGTEILGYRDDCGVLLIRWTCAAEFLTESQLEGFDEEGCFKEDWFYADFVQGGRLEGAEVPTHWSPLPESP